MNGKQIACIILLLVIGSVLYAAQMVHKKTASVRAEATAAEDAAKAAKSDAENASIKLETGKSNTDEIRRFLDAWTPDIERMQTNQEIEEAITDSIRDVKLYVDSQKIEPKGTSTNPVIPQVVKVSIIAEDDYDKTMNWLGDLEKRLPLARINVCRITGGKQPKSIRMELSIDIPIVNLKAVLSAKTS